jgi:hypothetical protein
LGRQKFFSYFSDSDYYAPIETSFPENGSYNFIHNLESLCRFHFVGGVDAGISGVTSGL